MALLILTTPEVATQTGEVVAADDGPNPVELEAYVDGLVDGLMREHEIPGVTLAISGSNDVHLLKGYGLANAPRNLPVTADQSLFRIGSISKTFIWTAVMLLVDRGQLDLDRDINDYLTEFQIDDSFEAPVTMRHLMAHRAGFETTLKVFQASDDDPRTLAQALADTQPARVRATGLRTSYSNWGAALAAHVVEAVSGQSFSTFVQTELLEPLGMGSTTLVQPGKLEPDWKDRMAIGHKRIEGRFEAADPMQIGPFVSAGGIASTAADMARWMRFHLNGGALGAVRLMRPETHALMWTRAYDDHPAVPDLAGGFENFSYAGVEVFGHGGSTGNFNSLMLLVPELDLGIFASQNSGSGGYATVNQVAQRVIERKASRSTGTAQDVDPQGSQEGIEEYAGSYRTNRRSFTTLAAIFSLTPTLSIRTGDDGSLIVDQGGDTHRYFPIAGQVDAFVNDSNQRLAGVRDQQGRVIAIHDNSGVHSHERVEGRDAVLWIALPAALALVLSLTTFLGFWRRWRQQPESNAWGRMTIGLALASALGVLLVTAILLVALQSLLSLDAAGFQNYPPTSLVILNRSIWLLVLLSMSMIIGLIPAWTRARWSLWRRLHYTSFALVLIALCAQLYYWNLIAAPLI